jgi:putative methyltransferase (TIGR04325 family)
MAYDTMAPKPTSIPRALVRSFKEFPVVRSLREYRYARAFRRASPGLHYGVFPTFEQAKHAAPENLGVGFDRASLTRVYDYRMKSAMPSDYPVLFWLGKVLQPNAYVFDYGGHIGISFHCFERYLGYPPGIRWRVGDVQAIIEEGRRFAAERGATALSFTTEFADADGADVLLALGSLQFIEENLWQKLARLARKPRHIIISKVPLYDGPTFYTLQHTGDAVHPYRISNRAEFVAGIESAGYRMVDEWTNREQSCHVPFKGGTTVDAYSGFIFSA